MSESKNQGMTIVVPAYNEEQAIAETLKSLRQVTVTLGGPAEIIVVNDGSSDQTGPLAKAAGVRVIEHPVNSGYGRSIMAGIDAAAFETIAILDADGSYACEDLAALKSMYDRGFDMVVGAREGRHYYSSFLKRLLRIVFKFLAEFSTGRSIPDINSGMRIFRKAPVLAFRDSISTGFSFTTTVTLLFFLNGFYVGYHPIPYRQRVGRSKVRLIRDSLRSLQIVLTAIAQFNPLKLYLLLGLADAAVSLALLAELLAGASDSIVLLLSVSGHALCLLAGLAILSVSKNRPHANPPRNS